MNKNKLERVWKVAVMDNFYTSNAVVCPGRLYRILLPQKLQIIQYETTCVDSGPQSWESNPELSEYKAWMLAAMFGGKYWNVCFPNSDSANQFYWNSLTEYGKEILCIYTQPDLQ
jgi:hypothetical protein